MSGKVFDPARIDRLETPERLAWLPPGEVADRLRLHGGMTIADIGAGSGYFSIPFARMVAPGGRVYAVDLQPKMLEFLSAKLRRPDAPANIETVEGSADRTGVPDGACDLVFLAEVWHEIDDRAAVLREVTRILRPGGRLAILDWRPDLEPPPGPPAHHRIAAADTAAELEASGWRVSSNGPVGRFSYLAIASLTTRSEARP